MGDYKNNLKKGGVLIPKAYCGDEPYIFVSYSHRDRKEVIPVINKMQEMKYRLWFDEGIDPGTEWDENIASHIEKCYIIIAFLSNNYLLSENCKDELNFARELNKGRLLIYLENVELPKGMAMRLNRLQNIHKDKYVNDEDFYIKLGETKNIKDCKEVTSNQDKLNTEYSDDSIKIFKNQKNLKKSLENSDAAKDKSNSLLYNERNKSEDKNKSNNSNNISLYNYGINEIVEKAKKYLFEFVPVGSPITISFLQKKLSIGYSVSLSVINKLVEEGYIKKVVSGNNYQYFLMDNLAKDRDDEIKVNKFSGVPGYNDVFSNLNSYDEFNDGVIDDLFEKIKGLVEDGSRISISLLQRKFSLGYHNAKILMDKLFEEGYIEITKNSESNEVKTFRNPPILIKK